MTRSLRTKFVVLLVAVSIVALSSALLLRHLMIRDFGGYLEGEAEDRVYWITADLERTYEKHGGWNRETLDEDALWALMLGFHVRVTDSEGRLVGDTETAIASLSPLMRARSLPGLRTSHRPEGSEYVPYPLFVAAAQIGMLEVAPLEQVKEAAFIRRSNAFLLVSLFALGAVAVILSAAASRRLTRPLKDLAAAVASIGAGDLTARVTPSGDDEIGALGHTFNRMATGIESIEKLRKTLLTNVAHELRTPLGAIRAELEGMLDGLLPVTKDGIQSLHDETGRLKRLLDGMEDLVRAQGSALSLRKERVSLRPLLQQVVDRVERGVGSREVQLTLECTDELAVEADPDKLSQVVINLLDNAVKAVGQRGSIRVRASASQREVVLEVADDGAGIAADELPLIFERFYSGSRGGLGIGLAIVKELVEAHGGVIDVESHVGQGSVFTVRLPS
jgi:two-component system sensor histidine kinase BaeS